jgi:alpha-1,2-mannosyltransferase
MSGIRQQIESGVWLTAERIRIYCVIVLAMAVLAIAVWVALADGAIDRNGKPLGTDFSNVYAAGTLVWQGKAADAYDPPLQHAAEIAVFGGRDVPFYGWHYPPFFLVIAALVAAVPYLWGLALWQIASFIAYCAAMRAILPRHETLLVASAFPAVFVNIGHGHNGFLTTALLGGALLQLHRHPWIAGVLIGLIAYKPQFGVLIPLALMADGRWRTIAAAAITVIALTAVSTMMFGTGIWHAFTASTAFTRDVVLEQGGTGWPKIQSIFSAVRMWGADVSFAYVAQGLLALCVALSLIWLWRSNSAFALKASALAIGSLLATPYVLDYDLVVLAIAIAWFARHGLAHGFRNGEISVLAVAWLMPLLARSVAGTVHLPFGLLTMIAFYAVVIRRAVLDRQASRHHDVLAAA